MTLNRTLAPDLKLPGKTTILQPVERKLDNGLSVYVINSGNEDVVKFEIVYTTENPTGNSFLSALACHQLIDTGTKNKKAIEIAEELDYYGAFLQADTGPDYKSLSLYTLGPLFNDSIKIVHEILNEAVFPETEISNWIKRNIQAYSVNSEKVSWLAKKSFNETIYGKTHAYGYTPDEISYQGVTRESLQSTFKNTYRLEKSIIILSGNISEKIIDAVNFHFGSSVLNVQSEMINKAEIPAVPKPSKIKIDKPDTVQSAIRIGRQLFDKSHPDFLPLLIANTILGGYFGSRLMTNIREDKGYTYGIGSGLQSHLKSGSFFIATEVGKNVCGDAVQEIYFELQRMTDQLVSENELKIVRNYLFGAFQRSIDGPFELAERFKGLKLHGLNYDYFDKYLDLLNKITPKQIMEISAKYLHPNMMTEVIAG